MKEGEEEATVGSETVILKIKILIAEIKKMDVEEVAQENKITRSKLETF